MMFSHHFQCSIQNSENLKIQDSGHSDIIYLVKVAMESN